MKAHFIDKPISKVLIDSGSIVNIMLVCMLKALGRNIDDLIKTEVSISAFNKEVSKTLGNLPIDLTVGNKTSLSVFFVINFMASYNTLLDRD